MRDADFEMPKKQRRNDAFEDDVISCTQHFLPINLSGNDEDRFRDELGFIKEERSVGLLKSFKEQSIRRGLSGLPSMFTTKEFAQLELTPGGGVDLRGGADVDSKYGVHRVGEEDSPNGVGSPKLSKGPVSCSNPADVVGSGNKDSVSGDVNGKGFFQFVSHEGGVMLPPTFKTPEEGRPRRGFGAGRRTPKSRSRSRSKGGDEGFCSTPYSRSSKNSDRRSLSGGKSGGWQYHSSMFSPGDSFWDEAIEAADGLFVADADGILPKQSNIGKSMLSSAERTARAIDGATHNQMAEAAGTAGVTEDVGASLGDRLDTSVVRCPADIPAVISEGITNTGLIFNRRFDELDVSPLPVRRFSFTRQSSSPRQNIIKLEIEEILKVPPTGIQFPVGAVLQEPLDVKDILSRDQVSTGANVNTNGVLNKLREEQLGTDLQPEALAPVGADTTSTLLEVASRTPLTSAERVISGQICVYTHPSEGDIPERSEAGKPGAVVPKEEVAERASISRSLKNTSLELSDWLPPEACDMYARKGLKRFYPWQVILLSRLWSVCILSIGLVDLSLRSNVGCSSSPFRDESY